MIIDLVADESVLLKKANIPFDSAHDYSEEDALALLDQVREAQVSYAQGEDAYTQQAYTQYSRLADKIFALIW